jgi:hypothetical protein
VVCEKREWFAKKAHSYFVSNHGEKLRYCQSIGEHFQRRGDAKEPADFRKPLAFVYTLGVDKVQLKNETFRK